MRIARAPGSSNEVAQPQSTSRTATHCEGPFGRGAERYSDVRQPALALRARPFGPAAGEARRGRRDADRQLRPAEGPVSPRPPDAPADVLAAPSHRCPGRLVRRPAGPQLQPSGPPPLPGERGGGGGARAPPPPPPRARG